MTTTISPVTTDLATQVAATLIALREAGEKLPSDDSLATAKEVEANFVRRTSLNSMASQLRIDLRNLEELEPRLTVIADWITTLKQCRDELEKRLADAEEAERHDARTFRSAEMLRHSLRTIHDGPELVHGGEFLTDTLIQWLSQHHVSPLPGETRLFSGRGGLRSAERRLAELDDEATQSRAQVERTLQAATTLLE